MLQKRQLHFKGVLARVCRPGGRLALTAWPADDWSETHARAGRTFVEDADAREWSKEEHVRRLLGDDFDLELQTGDWRIEAESGAELWELASTSMPPLRAWLAEQNEEARARAAMDRGIRDTSVARPAPGDMEFDRRA